MGHQSLLLRENEDPVYEPLEQSLQEFPADFAGSNLEPLGTGYEAFVAGRFCSAAM